MASVLGLITYFYNSSLRDLNIMEPNNMHTYHRSEDQDSSVGIVTLYGMDSLGFESRLRARLTGRVQTGPGANPASGSFPGVKDQGVALPYTPHPEPRLKKE